MHGRSVPKNTPMKLSRSNHDLSNGVCALNADEFLIEPCIEVREVIGIKPEARECRCMEMLHMENRGQKIEDRHFGPAHQSWTGTSSRLPIEDRHISPTEL